MKRNLPILTLLAGATIFVAGLIYLFLLRFETGDVYPPYSSLRSDPLGTMALCESLEKIPGVEVRRDLRDANVLPEERATTYLHLAAEVGACRAKELILLCEQFDAPTAERYGMLNRVVAPDALDATVNDWAQRIAAKPGGALHITKTQFQAYAHTVPLGDAGAADGDLTAAAGREAFALFTANPKR